MRQFQRPNVTTPTLKPEGAGGKKRAGHIAEYEKTGVAPSDFSGHWTKPDIRGALYAMQGRVCIYCGADIDEAGIDVEHFRPKGKVHGDESHGGYWWLAYDFSKYVLSCVICNQQCKRSYFPLSEGSRRVRFPERERLMDEERILLDPTLDLVEEWIQVDWRTPGGRLIPNPRLAPQLQKRVAGAIEFFG